ncbi:MAG: glycosyltransferase family 2 protein [Chloroflexota bacterium]
MSMASPAGLPRPPRGKAEWPWVNSTVGRTNTARSDTPERRISIVTPSFNQADFLEKTIRSVLLQGYPDLEYIVVDGGSTDGSVEIIRKYERHLAYWVSETDAGQSHAINKGFSRATGDIFAWLNSDDFYAPGVLSRVAAEFAARPEIGLVYGDCLFLDEGDGSTRLRPARQMGFDRLLVGDNPIWQPSTFFRRSVFEEAGGVDESLHLALDYDLWLRSTKSTQFLLLGGPPLSVVHDHPRTKSRRHSSEFIREILRAVENFYNTPDVPAEAVRLRPTSLAHLYFECGSATALAGNSLRAALPWFLRAVRADFRMLLRAPWIGWKLSQLFVRRAVG